MGGFDSLKEAFGEYEKYIYAVETGLSSSPDMNWRIGELDTRSIVSFSDAHSGPKLGREATVFSMPELSYNNVSIALKNYQNDPRLSRIESTIEFYPEKENTIIQDTEIAISGLHLRMWKRRRNVSSVWKTAHTGCYAARF
jgi:hypothetical protein